MFIKIHIVQQGDTLQSIIKQYNTTKHSIKKMNTHIANFDSLKSGMKIKITSTARFIQPHRSNKIERIQPLTQQNSNKEDTIIAHVDQRPIGGEGITYDQIWNAYQYILNPSANLQSINNQAYCHHCQQPIYQQTEM